MSKTLKLGIVIPAYNEEKQIGPCLEAIAEQKVRPDEVIVVDNNCTDKTIEIAKKFSFVKVVKESKQGIVYARDKGFNAVNSDIIARIDADTVLHPGWVATAKKIALTLEEDTAVTGPTSFYDSKLPRLTYAVHRPIYFWLSRATFGHTILFGSNMFFWRKQWLAVRKDACRRNDIHEDMDLAAHIILDGGKIKFDKRLKAAASARRFKNWNKYPAKWARTWTIHGLLPARYQAIRRIYDGN